MKKIILLLLFLIIQINCLHFIEDETDENDITSPEYVEKLEETLKKSGILEEETEDNLIEATKDACLADEKDLSDIGILNPDKNQRFIMGKCNPIVFVNGVYASRLSVEMNCKKLSEESEKIKEFRLYCGNAVCQDETKEYEEHVLWPAVMGSPFSIVSSDKTKYSACLGYIFTHFNNKDECPKYNGENICRYDDNIRIKFYGGTRETKSKSRCGLKAFDGVGSTGSDFIDGIVNKVGSLTVYKKFIAKFKKMGYEEGFSMAGVPQDFRRYSTKNTFNFKALTYHINRMYEQTGKPVILVGHSYGCTAIYAYLSKAEPEVLKKVKKFIAMAPPFAGSTKLLSVYLNGMNNFNIDIHLGPINIIKTDYSRFAQHIMYGSVPVIGELTPLPVLNNWFTDSNFVDYSEAILERLDLQKTCFDGNCSDEYIEEHSVKFEKAFGKGVFPSFKDLECKLGKSSNKFLGIIEDLRAQTFFHDSPCRQRLYNIAKCPSLIKVNADFNPKPTDFESLCGIYNSSLYYAEKCGIKGHKCLDSIFKEGPYPYRDTEKVNWLLERYNTNFSDKYDGKKLNSSYFEKDEKFRNKSAFNVEYHRNISLHQSLPIPPVDTVVLYSDVKKTAHSLLFDPQAEEKEPTEDEKLISGGDETVPNWSAYLVGMKWLYDKNTKNLKQNVQLVEYCSKLGKNGTKYAYDKSKNQTYYAIGCECLNSKFTDFTNSKCTHSNMLGDKTLVNHIAEISIDYNLKDASEKMKIAAKNYKIKDFIGECNEELYSYGDPL